LLVVIALGAATIFAAVVRLTDRIAINPWEPAIAIEAVRLNAGLPIYDSAHATHMYGPLLTVVLAGIFRVTGLNLLAARIVVSIFALVLALFLAVLLCRKCSRGWIAFAALLFLGINFRTNLALLSAQPDCIAILIACLGLLLWTRRNSLIGYVRDLSVCWRDVFQTNGRCICAYPNRVCSHVAATVDAAGTVDFSDSDDVDLGHAYYRSTDFARNVSRDCYRPGLDSSSLGARTTHFSLSARDLSLVLHRFDCCVS